MYHHLKWSVSRSQTMATVTAIKCPCSGFAPHHALPCLFSLGFFPPVHIAQLSAFFLDKLYVGMRVRFSEILDSVFIGNFFHPRA